MENDVDILVEDLIEIIQFDLDEIAEDSALDDIGGLCESVQNDYRTLAILYLTSEMNIKFYYENLVRSSRMRLYYLRRCQNENYKTNPRVMSSRNEPFLNAIAANEFGLSSEIAQLTSSHWWKEDEYEDDFCYSHFLHILVQFGHDNIGTLKELITRYENALKDNAGARIEVMQALLLNDSGKFSAAFSELIRERTLEITSEAETGLSIETQWQMDAIVFIEGLALLNIASHIGLKPPEQYMYCPEIVRNIKGYQAPQNGYLTP